MENSTKAVHKWCSISNAIISKYKPMSDGFEGDPQRASKDLDEIKEILISNGFFEEDDFKDYPNEYNILLSELLGLDSSDNVGVRLISTNAEGINPLEDVQPDPSRISNWLFWRYNNKYFRVGDIAVGLISIGGDEYVLATVQKVVEDLGKTDDVCFIGTELTNLKPYFGRVIVKYHRKHEQCKIVLRDKEEELIVDRILCKPMWEIR